MTPAIFLFPGQSSRDPAMFDRLAAAAAAVGAPDLAARAVARLRAAGVDERAPADNRSVQLTVFAATCAWRTIAAARGLAPVASAGHSLGEYAHLVAIGALSEDAAWDLVDARGRAYDAGPDGAMVAVQPLSASDLAAALSADTVAGAPQGQPLEAWLACENSPTQLVLGGATGDVARVLARLEEEHYAFGTWIERRVPMHTPRFAPAAAALRRALDAAPWRPPTSTYWSNVLGGPAPDASVATIVELLTRHVSEPVRWRSLVSALLQRHPGVPLVEVGPRHVLTDLVRRWLPDQPVEALDV